MRAPFLRWAKRTTLDVLEEAVSPETLRDILPVTYTALLHRDQSVRSGGIDLWVACARVADALPGEMSELAIPLLDDRYVIVHKRMLAQCASSLSRRTSCPSCCRLS